MRNVFVTAALFWGLGGVAANACCSIQVPGTSIIISTGTETKGKVFKPASEMIEQAAAGTLCGQVCAPTFQQLAPEEKSQIAKAIATTGFVVPYSVDPKYAVVVAVLSDKDADRHLVNIYTPVTPPTGRTWTIKTDCIVRRADGGIQAMAKDNFPHVTEVARGDTVKMSAPSCPEYNVKGSQSLESATIRLNGLALDALAKDEQ